MDDKSYPLWRSVGQQLVKEIDQGGLKPGKRLPPSRELAEQLGVNRNTLLKAIAHLQEKGLLRTEQGRRGTFVSENAISYRLGARTQFEENILRLNYTPIRQILKIEHLEATESIASELDIEAGDSIVLVSLVGQADRIPINFGLHYFAAKRVPRIAEAFERLRTSATVVPTIAAALNAVGVLDFKRGEIRVRTRRVSKAESRILKMPDTEHVLDVEVVNIDMEGQKIMYSQTAFPGSRVKIIFDPTG